MKVDYTIVAGILGHRLEVNYSVIHHLVKGLNDLTAIYDRMEFLKGEQDMADAMHLEATEELENQMIEVQSKCPHFTLLTETKFLVCATCGKIVEDQA